MGLVLVEALGPGAAHSSAPVGGGKGVGDFCAGDEAVVCEMCTAVSGGEPPSAKRALSLDAAVTREPLSPSAAAGAASAEVEMGVARYDDCVCAWVQASACPAAATHICNLPSEV